MDNTFVKDVWLPLTVWFALMVALFITGICAVWVIVRMWIATGD